MHSTLAKVFYCTDCAEILRKVSVQLKAAKKTCAQFASPKWHPMPEIAWNLNWSPWDRSIKPLRVISIKTTQLAGVLLWWTQLLLYLQYYYLIIVYYSMSCMWGISKQILTLKTLSLPLSSPGSLTSTSTCKSHKKRKTTS